MIKPYEAVVGMTLYIKVKASDKSEAKNKVIEILDKMKENSQMDVISLDIVEKS